MNDDVVIDEQEQTIVVGDDEPILEKDEEVTNAQETHANEGKNGEEAKEEFTDEEKEEFTDEEKDAYGKRVQKRINQLNGKIHERDDIIAKQQKDQEELRNRFQELEKKIAKADDSREANEINDRINKIAERRASFINDGDYDSALALDDELIDLKIKKRDISRLEDSGRVEDPQDSPVSAYEPPVPQNYVPEAQREWLVENDWYFNPHKLSEAKKANDVYISMINEGFDPEDEETYKVLSKRLAPKKAPPPSAQPDRGRNTGRPRSVQFTERDKERMRDYNLDPNNEKHRNAWLKEKRA